MLIVQDNVFSKEIAAVVARDYIELNKSCDAIWCNGSFDETVRSGSLVSSILKSAAKHFDLSKMVGFEYWAHYNSGVGWHYDKDEVMYNETGVLRLPLCGIVYYPIIENLSGGWFVTHSEKVQPRTNRAVMFSADKEHMVERFTGTRLSVSINPWDVKPKAYL